jgi:hypothetical protein
MKEGGYCLQKAKCIKDYGIKFKVGDIIEWEYGAYSNFIYAYCGLWKDSTDYEMFTERVFKEYFEILESKNVRYEK